MGKPTIQSFFFIIVQIPQVELAAGDIQELLSVEFPQMIDQPFVNSIMQQDNLYAFLAEYFQMRAVGSSVVVFCSHIVNLVLLRLCSFKVG